MKGVVDLKEYMKNSFCPMDVLGVTMAHPLAQIVWRATWAKDLWNWFMVPYGTRAGMSTHIAVCVLGKDGRKWIMEMDTRQVHAVYINLSNGLVMNHDHWEVLDEREKLSFQRICVNHKLILRPVEAYMPETNKGRHVCWIGRPLRFWNTRLRLEANELMFRYYKDGVDYTYTDLWSYPNVAYSLIPDGVKDTFISTVIPQRVFTLTKLLPPLQKPLSPMDWQQNRNLTATIRLAA